MQAVNHNDMESMLDADMHRQAFAEAHGTPAASKKAGATAVGASKKASAKASAKAKEASKDASSGSAAKKAAAASQLMAMYDY